MTCLCASLSSCSILDNNDVVPIKYAVNNDLKVEFTSKIAELEVELQNAAQAVSAAAQRNFEQLVLVQTLKKIIIDRIKGMDSQITSDLNALSESVLRRLLQDKELQGILSRQVKKTSLLLRLFRSINSFNESKNSEKKRTQWFLNHRVRALKILHSCGKSELYISMKELLALLARYDPPFAILYSDHQHIRSTQEMIAYIEDIYGVVCEAFRKVSLVKITLPQALQVLYSNTVLEDSLTVHLALCMQKSEDSSSVYCARAFFNVERFTKPRHVTLLEGIEKYLYSSVEAKILGGTAQIEDIRRVIALRMTKYKADDLLALFNKSRTESMNIFKSHLQAQYQQTRVITFQNIKTSLFEILKMYDYRFVENALLHFPSSGITTEHLFRLKNRYIEETQSSQILALMKKSKVDEVAAIYNTYDLLSQNWKCIERITRKGEVLDVAICIHDIFQRYKNASKEDFVVLSSTRRGGGCTEGACRRIHCVPAEKEAVVVSDYEHSVQRGTGASKIMRIALYLKQDEFLQVIAYSWTKLYERSEDSEREIQHQKLLQGKGILPLIKSFNGAVPSFRLVPQLEHIWWTALGQGSLNDVAKKKLVIPENQLLKVCTDIIQAIAYIHSKEVIHGDLKDANVLYTVDTSNALSPMIADFGLTASAVVGKPINGWCGHYNKGIYGSVYLTDPQLLRGDNKEGPFVGNHFKIEMFAVGVLLYQLLNKGAYPAWISRLRAFHKDGMQASKRVFYGKMIQRQVETYCNSYAALQTKFTAHSLSTVEKVQYLICRLWDQNLTTRPTAEEAIKLLA